MRAPRNPPPSPARAPPLHAVTAAGSPAQQLAPDDTRPAAAIDRRRLPDAWSGQPQGQGSLLRDSVTTLRNSHHWQPPHRTQAASAGQRRHLAQYEASDVVTEVQQHFSHNVEFAAARSCSQRLESQSDSRSHWPPSAGRPSRCGKRLDSVVQRRLAGGPPQCRGQHVGAPCLASACGPDKAAHILPLFT